MSQAEALEAIRGRATCSVAEAGVVLGVSRAVTYQAARDGTLPTLRVGGRVVVLVQPLLRQLGIEENS